MKCLSLTLSLLIYATSVVMSQDDIRMYIFGHSLINHEYEVTPPVPSDETSVPHWVGDMAAFSDHTFAVDGQYGFLPTHLNLPPIAQWGFDLAPGVWDSDNQPFSEADFNTILITPANFVQYLGPDEFPYNDLPEVSPVDATTSIFDWTLQQESNLKLIIYEHWPDMGTIAPSWPATQEQFDTYNNQVVGTHHDWFIAYHDLVRANFADGYVSMIPVGPIIAELFINDVIPEMPIGEIYQDNAPHGRATTYFLAGLITYMAIYEEFPSESYVVPEIIHENVRNNISAIKNYTWNYLQNFNDSDGNSRVFASSTQPVDDIKISIKNENNHIVIDWNVTNEINVQHYIVEKFDGRKWFTIQQVDVDDRNKPLKSYRSIDDRPIHGSNTYRIRIVDFDGQYSYSPLFSIKTELTELLLYPNPAHNELYINIEDVAFVELYDVNHKKTKIKTSTGKMDVSGINPGVYICQVITKSGMIIKEKLIIY